MSTNSNDRGRAYEYAWINVLQEKIDQLGSASIVKKLELRGKSSGLAINGHRNAKRTH